MTNEAIIRRRIRTLEDVKTKLPIKFFDLGEIWVVTNIEFVDYRNVYKFTYMRLKDSLDNTLWFSVFNYFTVSYPTVSAFIDSDKFKVMDSPFMKLACP